MTHDDALPPHLQRLGNQLMAAHPQATMSSTRLQRPPRLPGLRPRLWVSATAATVSLAVVAIAVVLLASGTATPPPAFAVTLHRGGSVSVRLNSASGVAGANRKLASLGIHEHVTAAKHTGYPQDCHLRRVPKRLRGTESLEPVKGTKRPLTKPLPGLHKVSPGTEPLAICLTAKH